MIIFGNYDCYWMKGLYGFEVEYVKIEVERV